jgi:hypothetical protein
MFGVTTEAIRRIRISTGITAGLLLVGVSIASVIVTATPATAAVGINHTVNFQGKVVNTDGTNVANGTYSFVFKLYSVSSAGSALWTESKSLTVTDGIFQTNLGDVTSLPGSVDFNTDSIYLGINFNSDGEMSPRILFTAAAYAFNSEKLGGIAAAGFAQINPGSAQAGSLNIGTSVQAGVSLQAPLVDAATAVALNIGTSTATSVTVGRATSSNAVNIQGSSSSIWSVTGASGSTTLAFTAPTAANTITFPNAGGTVCTSVATTCSATYQAASGTGYLLKNAQDTSSASVAGTLLTLTNSNAGSARVLDLVNNGTGSSLYVNATSNPGAGSSLIRVNNTAGTPSGNLLDLQSATVSKFTVDTNGATTAASTFNGQTISSSANFTGTVTAVTSVTVPSVVSAAGTALSVTGSTTLSLQSTGANAATLDSGNAGSVNIGTGSGGRTVNIGATGATASATAIHIGDTSAANNQTITIGSTAAGQSDVLVQGGSGSGQSFGVNLQVATNGNINIGANNANTVNIGYNGSGASVSAVNIAAGTGTGGSSVNIGSITGVAGTVALFGGSGVSGQVILDTGASGTIQIGNTASSITQTVNIGNNATVGSTSNVLVGGSIAGTTTVQGATSLTLKTSDSATTSTNGVVLRSGNATVGTNLSSGSITIDSGTHTGAGASGSVLIGQTNAGATLIGRAAAQLTLQGVSSTSSIIANSGANSTTISFTTPTATNAISVPNAGGTLCTTTASTCNTTYQIAGSYQAAGSYLLQNPGANQTSTSSFVGTQYTFIQNGTGASTALNLQNAGTNAAFSVTQSANPTAGQAIILGNNTNGAPSGNLIDLQSNAVSKFSVSSTGAVVSAGTINGQTISAVASFTGTITSASQISVTAGGINVSGNSTIAGSLGGITGLTVASGGAAVTGNSTITGTLAVSSNVSAPGFQSADTAVASTNSAATTFRSGNATGTTSNSGSVTVDSGTATGTAGTVSLGTGNASSVSVGRSAAQLSLQGSATSTIGITTGASTTTIGFASPTANVTYTLGTAAAGSYNICTTVAISCSSVYQAAGSYLAKNAIDTSSATLTAGQTLLALSNNGGTGSTTLSVNNGAATGNALYVTAAANPTAGNALLVLNNTNGTPSGNLLDLQVSATSKYSVNYQGNVTGGLVNGQTITSAASFTGTVTSASTITASAGGINVTGTGQFNNAVTITGVLTANGGASISTGINNNAGGITAAGAVSGLSSLQYNTNGTLDTAASNTIAIGGTNASGVAVGRTGTATTVNGTASIGSAAGTGALLNNGSTVNTTYTIANLPTGGWDAGGAAATVDKYTYLSAGQTTASQTLTIPAPTASTTFGRLIYLTNTGTASFSLLTTTIGAGSTATLVWANVNGTGTWTFAGADGSGILNQNSSDQTAGFRITGVGQANTSFRGPLFDAITASTLNVGTGTANAVVIGNTGITTNIVGTFTVGTGTTGGTGTFINNGSTQNKTLALTTIGSGTLGTAAATVDIYTAFTINQTTANQTITVPTPTIGAAASTGRIIYISNIGTTNFTLLTGGATMNPGSTATLVFNGSAWTFAGADSSGISNQSAANQAASFNINGTGVIGTGLQIGGALFCSASCGDLNFATGSNRVIKVLPAVSGNAGNSLTMAAGDGVGTNQAGGALVLQGGASTGIGAGGVVTVRSQTNSTAGFTVQNSGSVALLTVDTTGANTVIVGDTTNGAVFDTNKQLVLNGTARHQKTIRLNAEYNGAVLDSGGQASVTGTMTAGNDSTQRMTYYKWTTNQATAQTYDIVVNIPLPDDWSAWNGNPSFYTNASSIVAGQTMTIVSITRTDGTADAAFASKAITPGVINTWTANNGTAFTNASNNYAAGGTMTVRIRFSAINSNSVQLGDLLMPYYSKY